MCSNRLKLNGDKTELTIFSSPRLQKQLPPVSLTVDGVPIPPQSACRNLGSFFDLRMAMDTHIDNLCKSCHFHLSNIQSIRHLLDIKTTESLIHAFVSSRLDFCNSLLFGISKSNISKLQKIQNRAARICLKVSRKSHISSSSLLAQLHWLPITYRIKFKILLLTFKCLNGLAPPYLSELLHFSDTGRTTRSSSQNLLVVPKSRTKTYGDRTFEVAAPGLWNNLPLSVRQSESVVTFKKSLKTFLFTEAF